MSRRYLAIVLSEEYVVRWEIGFQVLARIIEREMKRHRFLGWPDLRHAELTQWGWKLVFTWPGQDTVADLLDENGDWLVRP